MILEISEKLSRELSWEDLEEEFCCVMIRWNYCFEQMMSLASKVLTEDILFSLSSFSLLKIQCLITNIFIENSHIWTTNSEVIEL